MIRLSICEIRDGYTWLRLCITIILLCCSAIIIINAFFWLKFLQKIEQQTEIPCDCSITVYQLLIYTVFTWLNAAATISLVTKIDAATFQGRLLLEGGFYCNKHYYMRLLLKLTSNLKKFQVCCASLYLEAQMYSRSTCGRAPLYSGGH